MRCEADGVGWCLGVMNEQRDMGKEGFEGEGERESVCVGGWGCQCLGQRRHAGAARECIAVLVLRRTGAQGASSGSRAASGQQESGALVRVRRAAAARRAIQQRFVGVVGSSGTWSEEPEMRRFQVGLPVVLDWPHGWVKGWPCSGSHSRRLTWHRPSAKGLDRNTRV